MLRISVLLCYSYMYSVIVVLSSLQYVRDILDIFVQDFVKLSLQHNVHVNLKFKKSYLTN